MRCFRIYIKCSRHSLHRCYRKDVPVPTRCVYTSPAVCMTLWPNAGKGSVVRHSFESQGWTYYRLLDTPIERVITTIRRSPAVKRGWVLLLNIGTGKVFPSYYHRSISMSSELSPRRSGGSASTRPSNKTVRKTTGRRIVSGCVD